LVIAIVILFSINSININSFKKLSLILLIKFLEI